MMGKMMRRSGDCEVWQVDRFLCMHNYYEPSTISDLKSELPVLRFHEPNDADQWFDYLTNKGGENMRNDKFGVSLRSYDYNKSSVLTDVHITAENFETFKKIVDLLIPILEDEDIKKKDC